MDVRDYTIAFLLGIVTNIVTFLITRNHTTSRERDRFKQEERTARAEAADVAVGHLRSSYLAVRQLGLEVLERQRHNKENPEFDMTLWGIRHALEQMRLSLQGHMNAWRVQLRPDSPALEGVVRILQEDAIAGSRMSPTSLASDLRDATTTRSVEKKPSQVEVALDPPVGARKSRSLVQLMKESPAERVARMIADGDVQGLEDEVVLIAGKGGDVDKLVALGGMLAVLGSERAHGILVETMRNRFSEMDSSSKTALFTSIVQFYVRQDREREGIQLCRELLQVVLQDESLQPKEKAHSYNQIGMLLHHAGELREAAAMEEKALELAPDESAYLANHAKTYEALGDTVKAKLLFERALEIDECKDADHLQDAVRFFRNIGEPERAAELMKMLRVVDPGKATLADLFGTGR